MGGGPLAPGPSPFSNYPMQSQHMQQYPTESFMSHMMQTGGGAPTSQQYGQGGYDAGQQTIRPLGSLAPGAPIGPQTLDIGLAIKKVSIYYSKFLEVKLAPVNNWFPHSNVQNVPIKVPKESPFLFVPITSKSKLLPNTFNSMLLIFNQTNAPAKSTARLLTPWLKHMEKSLVNASLSMTERRACTPRIFCQ